MCTNHEINTLFTEFQRTLDQEQDKRQGVRYLCNDISQVLREATKLLQVIHYSEEGIVPACVKARDLFEKAQEGYARLKEAVPDSEYFRYQEHWRSITQRYCFLIALTVWLETGILATYDTVAQVLGISAVERIGFHLDTEDYLSGLLQLCSELARLAVNSATRGDYEKPLQISKFVMELNAAFRLLTFKNDHLRKRFDVLKYDVKKIEEVVYDIRIRGLPRAPFEAISKKSVFVKRYLI